MIAYLFIIYSHSTVLPPTPPAPPWIVNYSTKMILPAVPKMELNGIQAYLPCVKVLGFASQFH